MSLDPQEAKALIVKLVKAGVKTPVILEGGRGIGKSAIVKQAAEELKYHCIDIRLALDTPEDVAGYPRPNGDSVTYLINDWVKLCEEMAKQKEGVILFFDEINRAPLEVRQALFEIMTEYSVRRHKLPENTYICFAMNPDNGEYQVEPLDPAFQRRMIRIAVKPDNKAWIDWAKKNIDTDVIRFIECNPSYLFIDEKIDISATCNPDAWRMVSELGKADLSNNELTNCLLGIIGKEAATLYIRFIKEKTHPITAKELWKMNVDDICHYIEEAKKENVAVLVTVVDNVSEYVLNIYGKDKEPNTLEIEQLEKLLILANALPPEQAAAFIQKLAEEDKIMKHILKETDNRIVTARRNVAQSITKTV